MVHLQDLGNMREKEVVGVAQGTYIETARTQIMAVDSNQQQRQLDPRTDKKNVRYVYISALHNYTTVHNRKKQQKRNKQHSHAYMYKNMCT